jgi:hypothetical protein
MVNEYFKSLSKKAGAANHKEAGATTMTVAADARTARPAPDEYAPYYGTYIGKVADGDVIDAFEGTGHRHARVPARDSGVRGGHRYAEGKWSIREVVGHLADAGAGFRLSRAAFRSR